MSWRCRSNGLNPKWKRDCILQNNIAVLHKYCSFWMIFTKCLPSRFFVFNRPFCMWCACRVEWSESMWRPRCGILSTDMHMHLKNMQMEIHYQIAAALQINHHSQQKYQGLQDNSPVLLCPSFLNQLTHHHKSAFLYSLSKQVPSLSGSRA